MGYRITLKPDEEAVGAKPEQAARQWYAENREAVDAYNGVIEADGFLFSDGVRTF